MLRIGLVQMRCEKGAWRENLAQIAASLADAAARGVDVLGFPEMSLTGYADPNRYPQAVLRRDGPELEALRRISADYAPTIFVGLIEHNPRGKPFITQVALRRGALLGVYRKITIVDEEADWFAPGQETLVVPVNGAPVGLAICADIDNEAVFAACRRQGARIVFELAAPGLYGPQESRDWESGYRWWEGECQTHLARYARAHGLWIAVATQAGRTVDEDFPGGGYLFAPSGERLFHTADGRPGVVYLDIDLEAGTATAL